MFAYFLLSWEGWCLCTWAARQPSSASSATFCGCLLLELSIQAEPDLKQPPVPPLSSIDPSSCERHAAWLRTNRLGGIMATTPPPSSPKRLGRFVACLPASTHSDPVRPSANHPHRTAASHDRRRRWRGAARCGCGGRRGALRLDAGLQRRALLPSRPVRPTPSLPHLTPQNHPLLTTHARALLHTRDAKNKTGWSTASRACPSSTSSRWTGAEGPPAPTAAAAAARGGSSRAPSWSCTGPPVSEYSRRRIKSHTQFPPPTPTNNPTHPPQTHT